jgi:hypothetical protein
MLLRLKPYFGVSRTIDAVDDEQGIASTTGSQVRGETKDSLRDTQKETDTGDISSPDHPRPNPQDHEGIQRVEAITLVWSKKSLIATYCLWVALLSHGALKSY